MLWGGINVHSKTASLHFLQKTDRILHIACSGDALDVRWISENERDVLLEANRVP